MTHTPTPAHQPGMTGGSMSERLCLTCGHHGPHDQQRGFCRHIGCACDGPTYAPEATDPTPGEVVWSLAAITRLWSSVKKSGDCWLWNGRMRGGYGRIRTGKPIREIAAHRAAYEMLVGPIPEGMTLDHKCHTASDCEGGDDCPHRRCVNPAHLEPVTMRDNVLRSQNAFVAINARKTHCIHGHPFSGSNLIVTKVGKRACRECRRIRALARYHAKKGHVA